MPALHVRFYTRENCSLCDSAWAVLMRVRAKIFFTVERVDIDSEPSYASAYGTVIPVITARRADAPDETEVARSFAEEKVLFAALRTLQPDR